jgi:hypothetical protein
VNTEFLIFLGSGVLLLGLAFAVWMFVTKRQGQGIANWPSTEGQILKADVVKLERETPSGIVRTYTPVVSYTYGVAGQPYTSRRINFLPDDSATYSDKDRAQQAIAPYLAEAAVRVYYNPTNPKQATLEKPRPVAHNSVLLYGIVLMGVGAGLIALGIVLL